MDGQDWATPWWTPVAENAAVRWTRNLRTGETRSLGMVIHGEISTVALRALKVSAFDPTSYHLAEKVVYNENGVPNVIPPPAEVVALTWNSAQAIRQETEAELASGRVERIYSVPRRGPNESADEFYGRMAALLADLRQRYPAGPVWKLAEVMDVPKSTAVHWAREIKKREERK